MRREDFVIGQAFWCDGCRWRCTDIGSRTVVAIRIDRLRIGGSLGRASRTIEFEEAQREGWFNGPPYAVVEAVFDENAVPSCSIEKET